MNIRGFSVCLIKQKTMIAVFSKKRLVKSLPKSFSIYMTPNRYEVIAIDPSSQ